MDSRLCQATTKAGKPCSNAAQAGKNLCRFHDDSPEAQEARRENGRKGGQNKAGYKKAAKVLGRLHIRSASGEVIGRLGIEDCQDVLSFVIYGLTTGTLDSSTANSLSAACKALVGVTQAGTMQTQLEELQAVAERIKQEQSGDG